VRARVGAGLTIAGLGVAVFIAIGAVLAVGTALAVRSLEDRQTAVGAEEQAEAVARLAGRLAQAVARQNAELVSLGQEIVTPALLGGEEDVAAALHTLERRLPGATELRLVRSGAGAEAAEAEAVAGLGYACIDMVRRVGQGASPLPELHRQRHRDHVQFLEPVYGPDGDALGYLLVQLEASWIQAQPALAGIAAGYLELRQYTEGVAGLVVGLFGDEALRTGAPDVSTLVTGTTWELAYWPAPPPQWASAGPRRDYWLAFGAVLGALGGILLVGLGLLSRVLRHDLEVIAALAGGDAEAARRLRLSVCRHMAQRLGPPPPRLALPPPVQAAQHPSQPSHPMPSPRAPMAPERRPLPVTAELLLPVSGVDPRELLVRLAGEPFLESSVTWKNGDLVARFPEGQARLHPSSGRRGLAVRFRAPDTAALERVQARLRGRLEALLPDLDLPF
jgi:hypothetical protein